MIRAHKNRTLAAQTPSPYYGVLKELIEHLYEDLDADIELRKLDIVIAAETANLPQDLQELVALLPSGNYTYDRVCNQLNSIITGHAWGPIYGTL